MSSLCDSIASARRRLDCWALADTRRWSFTAITLVGVVGLFPCSLDYGVNVFITPVNARFHPNQDWSMVTGDFTYASSLGQVVKTVGVALVGPRILRFGLARAWLLGSAVCAAGAVLGGIGIEYEVLSLLYVGYGVIFNLGWAAVYMAIVLLLMAWFRTFGKPGLSSGLIGFLCGLWPATFSYWAPALAGPLGLGGVFYFCAALGIGLSLLGLPFLSLPSEMQARHNAATADASVSSSTGTAAPPPAVRPVKRSINEGPTDAVTISLRSFVRLRRPWLLFTGFSLVYAVGFGLKLVVSPFMSAAFAADEDKQQTASFLFLAVYCLMRLITGIFGDEYPVRSLLSAFTAIQAVTCAVLGCLAFWPVSFWAFVLVSVLIAATLAGEKVLLSIVCLRIWGAINVGTSFGMLLPSVGVGGLIGPITMWAVVIQVDMNGNGTIVAGTTANQGLESAAGAWFWTAAACTTVGGLLIDRSLARPHDFSLAAEAGKAESADPDA